MASKLERYALLVHRRPEAADDQFSEVGFAAYDIARLMGHANISTSRRSVRKLPVGAGEAVMLKNQRRHSSTALTRSAGIRAL